MTQTTAELTQAFVDMKTALADKTRWQTELQDALRAAAAEREALEHALYALIRTFPETRRPALRADIARVTRDLYEYKGRIGLTKRSRAMLQFLIESEHDEIRASELSFYLKRIGMDGRSRYAASALSQWAKQGIVARTGHGVYKLNRMHPEVLKMRVRAVEQAAKLL